MRLRSIHRSRARSAGDPHLTAPLPAVLLVPGWKDTHSVLEPLAQHLQASGWPQSHVHIARFRDPFASNREHAVEIDRAVTRLGSVSGADRIAIVAHSMGGLATRWYLAHGTDDRVRTAVFLATPHQGTWLAWLGWGAGAGEMRPRSPFLRELQTAPPPDDVRLVCFRARADTRLLPGASAWLEGAECRTLPGAGHRWILRQPRVFDEITKVLRES